jgi:hypothetical protein
VDLGVVVGNGRVLRFVFELVARGVGFSPHGARIAAEVQAAARASRNRRTANAAEALKGKFVEQVTRQEANR